MKIGGVSRTGQTGAARPVARAGGQSFALGGPEGPAPARPLSSPMPLTAVDAILALQETPDATADRRAGIARGESLLHLLDRIRLGLLDGTIPRAALRELLGAVRARRNNFADAALREILDEIELRAMVELAKLGEPV